MFDGGREWEDDQWLKEFERWNQIYTKPPKKETIMTLPGNHDIGFGNTLVYNAYERFRTYFGEPSSVHVIGNHSFVLLDTISMMNSENHTINSKPYEFMQSYVESPTFDRYPRILLTHVPLFRDPNLWCGPDRESKKPIPYVRGFQYQTMISPEISSDVLKTLKPVAVFAGDDHDACYVQHNYTVTSEANLDLPYQTEERTLKSASMAMGISKPGIQLLSLKNEIDPNSLEKTYQTTICYMPNPFSAFALYFVFGGFTIAVILALNFVPALIPSKLFKILSKNKPQHSKSQNESAAVSLLPSIGEELDEEHGSLNTRRANSRSTRKQGSFDLEGDPNYLHEQQLDFELDAEPEFGTEKQSVLAHARLLMKQKKNWIRIAKDLVLILGFCGFGFYLVLSWTIYW